MKNLIVSNSNGVLPMSGIHVEPNNPQQKISNVKISNIITFNNRKGLGVSHMHLIGNSTNAVDLLISNISDYYSNLVPVHIGGHRAKYPVQTKAVEGKIVIKDVNIYDPKKEDLLLVDRYLRLLPQVHFSNLKLFRKNKQVPFNESNIKVLREAKNRIFIK